MEMICTPSCEGSGPKVSEKRHSGQCTVLGDNVLRIVHPFDGLPQSLAKSPESAVWPCRTLLLTVNNLIKREEVFK